MRATMTAPAETSSGFDGAPVFRVRLWREPADPRYGWMLYEWDVEECTDVREVIEWAAAQEMTTYEVGVRWEDRAMDAQGRSVIRYRYVRVAGFPGDEGSTSHTVILTTGE